MRDVFVIGVGMTPFGRHMDKSCAAMAREAVTLAMTDAGATAADLGVAFYANTVQGAIEGQYGIKGQHALRALGIDGIPVFNVENACSGSGAALNLAYSQVAGGFADVALAVGSEKLNTKDAEKRFAAFNQPDDVAAVTRFLETYNPLVADVVPPPSVVIDPAMRSIFMDAYAINAKQHMKKHGTTWRQIAAVAAKNHGHSTMNPLAQFQNAMSIEEIMAGRVIAWPLTLPMCAPISDGATATIICSADALKRFNSKRAIRILASVMRSGTDRDFLDVENTACRLAAFEAYNKAGIGPKDISVAEVHDASAYAEIAQTEYLGLCEFGAGGIMAERGDTTLGGRIPVNVSGGLESKGHPVAATGLAQIYELVTQLRGEAGKRGVEGARFGLSCNGGGFIGVEEAITCVTLLGRD